MREAADLIRAEVSRLMEDVGRLQDRVVKLQQHHGQAGEDMRQILISSEKIGRRAGRIDALDFDEGNGATPAPLPLRLQAGE
jgi:DNA recombination protein RmuC